MLLFVLLLSYAALFVQLNDASCLGGDIFYSTGDSVGIIGYQCLNATAYEGSESFCGADGNLYKQEIVQSCAHYCVQCGPRGWGAALCLSTSAVPDHCPPSNDPIPDKDSPDSLNNNTSQRPRGRICFVLMLVLQIFMFSLNAPNN